jgi:dipeptidase
MCDTFVVVSPEAVWLAKNSDREPGEAQGVEHLPRARHSSATLRTTHVTIDQASETFEVVLSRPSWMWGAEMGANEHGVAIGNEAIFTRVPVERGGLLGMDLLRIALERSRTADDALERITWMLARHGQGGRAGFRDRRFTYHNAFMIADARGGWLLETAGRFWAALRVERGARTTSNVLTIGADYTRLGPGTIEGARSLGFLARGETFDFRRCFAQPLMSWLSGGDIRRACTARVVGDGAHPTSLETIARALRDHAGHTPAEGARIVMPCAHASWLPTRGAGQTTGTMASRLTPSGSTHFFTGTSAPCLSVLKQVPLGGAVVDTGPAPSVAGYDGASLFWRAERLHRVVLRDYDARRATFEDERRSLEARAIAGAPTADGASAIWSEHRERVVEWNARASASAPVRASRVFDAWWRIQSRRDGVPA